jgi:drug/metabolite transporter (DMT)-like permease
MSAAPALAVAFWRNAMATAVGAPYTLATRPTELVDDPGRSGVRPSLVAGVALAAHFALWIPSLRLTTVTAATALVCTTPVFLVAYDRLRGSFVPRAVVGGVAVSFVGVLVITGVDAGTGGSVLVGDLMALGGGAAAAGYMVAGAQARERLSTASYTLVAYGSCAVLLGAACLLFGIPLVGYSTRTWVELGLLTLGAQLLGHTLLNRALKTAGTTTVGLAILLEVPGAALVAWVWLGQVPPLAVIPGAALVVAGLAIVVRARAACRRAEDDAPLGAQ